MSTDSIQSSSGVSSTGSLHLSIGSGDNSTANQQQRLALANQKLPPNPPPSPSISLVVNTPSPPQTTPVKPLPPKPLGASPSHPPLKMGPAATSTPTKAPGTKPTPPPVPPRQSTNARPVIQATPQQQQQQLIQDHHHISTTYITQDDVVITSGAGAKTKQNQANCKAELFNSKLDTLVNSMLLLQLPTLVESKSSRINSRSRKRQLKEETTIT